jgi:SAM-dependent methyltransferase
VVPRPAHLTPENAARFTDPSVVAAYHLRLPYPPEVFEVLHGLIVDTPRAVLDAGTGTGDLARPLAPRVEWVDGVDVSAAMIARGKALPGGDHPHLRWIEGRIEEAPLAPSYALVTAGDSLHWMDWEVLLPRLHAACTPRGVLAIVERGEKGEPWREGLMALVRRSSTIRDFQAIDLPDELERRRLFAVQGRQETPPRVTYQAVDDYIASFRSRASLSPDRMAAEDAAAFDDALRDLVRPWSREGRLELHTVATMVWGRPRAGV